MRTMGYPYAASEEETEDVEVRMTEVVEETVEDPMLLGGLLAGHVPTLQQARRILAQLSDYTHTAITSEPTVHHRFYRTLPKEAVHLLEPAANSASGFDRAEAYALDCEMCDTTRGFEATRVSVCYWFCLLARFEDDFLTVLYLLRS